MSAGVQLSAPILNILCLQRGPRISYMSLWFEEPFAVLCHWNETICGHWVEIKYESLESVGPR